MGEEGLTRDLGVRLDGCSDLVVDGVGVAEGGVEATATLDEELGVVAEVIPSLRGVERAAAAA